MTAGAMSRGVVGVVIDGACRDLKEHRDAGFPVRLPSPASDGLSII